MTDQLRFNYSTLRKRSKSKSYQQQIEKLTTVLMTFLKEHQLLHVEPFNEDGSLKEDLIIRQSSLSEIGNELFKVYFPKWSNYIDRGGNIENTAILEKGLKTLQSKEE